ncbi:actin-binding Rho-activating protein [Aethina tumida]|uniref:actin-binding Rho-activating protein n=1 Tax=Aethina tumida TaxID=116153 RepID=UPI00096B500C|nr:actin-binding Rho-activating protein [Aethina tumida]
MSVNVANRQYLDAGLKGKVALFNKVADKHMAGQAVNPFSQGKVGLMPKPVISKEDYGKPAKGSLSETRAFKATIAVSREMLELCDVINQCGEPLFTEEEVRKNPTLANDPRIVISFGNLFAIYTAISDKVVGILIRARKHKLVDFEGECLFQRRDDHVPIILVKPISEIRKILNEKIEVAKAGLKENEEMYEREKSPYLE